MTPIQYWQERGFHLLQTFPDEYELWICDSSGQKLRRYENGREWLTDLHTGEYYQVLTAREAAKAAVELTQTLMARCLEDKETVLNEFADAFCLVTDDWDERLDELERVERSKEG